MRQHTLDRGSALRLAQLIAGEHWRVMAACGSAEPELFFPVSASASHPGQAAEAKAICARCLVRRECLAFAVRTWQVHGIWGGMTEEERYPLVKAEQERARVTEGTAYAQPPCAPTVVRGSS